MWNDKAFFLENQKAFPTSNLEKVILMEFTHYMKKYMESGKRETGLVSPPALAIHLSFSHICSIGVVKLFLLSR